VKVSVMVCTGLNLGKALVMKVVWVEPIDVVCCGALDALA
jgi:hypothetical protein